MSPVSALGLADEEGQKGRTSEADPVGKASSFDEPVRQEAEGRVVCRSRFVKHTGECLCKRKLTGHCAADGVEKALGEQELPGLRETGSAQDALTSVGPAGEGLTALANELRSKLSGQRQHPRRITGSRQRGRGLSSIETGGPSTSVRSSLA